MILLASFEPFSNSIPAYTSSVFSLNKTKSTLWGFRIAAGVPLNHLTGLTHAYRSNSFLNATFKERIPPPIGVVNGPLIPTKCDRKVSNVSSGSHSPFLS